MAMLLWVKYLEERALNAPGAQVSSRSLTCDQCPSGMFDETRSHQRLGNNRGHRCLTMVRT